jgi:DNA-binding CsgD family transcriptional regulator
VGALSPRELEVLKLVAEGLTNAQVAERLFVSPRMVNAHLNSIYHKLGVGSRSAAPRCAFEHDLV